MISLIQNAQTLITEEGEDDMRTTNKEKGSLEEILDNKSRRKNTMDDEVESGKVFILPKGKELDSILRKAIIRQIKEMLPKKAHSPLRGKRK